MSIPSQANEEEYKFALSEITKTLLDGFTIDELKSLILIINKDAVVLKQRLEKLEKYQLHIFHEMTPDKDGVVLRGRIKIKGVEDILQSKTDISADRIANAEMDIVSYSREDMLTLLLRDALKLSEKK